LLPQSLPRALVMPDAKEGKDGVVFSETQHHQLHLLVMSVYNNLLLVG
jgi:hypothetical protein